MHVLKPKKLGMDDKSSGRCGFQRVVFLVCAVVVTISVVAYVSQKHESSFICPAVNVPQAVPPTVQIVVNVPVQNETKDNSNGQEKSGRETEGWNYNWDFKAWKDPSEAKGVAVRTILLVRHGQYDLETGQLNGKGHRQANFTGQRLHDFNVKFDQIIHSELDRAKTTADLIHNYLPNVPVYQDPILSEGGPIQPKPTVTYWNLPDQAYFTDGPRLEAAFRKYFYRADKSQTERTRDLIVGHGNIFRYFILRALQLPPTAWMRVFLPHASISRIFINPDGTVTCDMFGDSGHIPPELVTL